MVTLEKIDRLTANTCHKAIMNEKKVTIKVFNVFLYSKFALINRSEKINQN